MWYLLHSTPKVQHKIWRINNSIFKTSGWTNNSFSPIKLIEEAEIQSIYRKNVRFWWQKKHFKKGFNVACWAWTIGHRSTGSDKYFLCRFYSKRIYLYYSKLIQGLKCYIMNLTISRISVCMRNNKTNISQQFLL